MGASFVAAPFAEPIPPTPPHRCIDGNRSHPGPENPWKLGFSQGPIAAKKGGCRCKSPKSRFRSGRQTPGQWCGFPPRERLLFDRQQLSYQPHLGALSIVSAGACAGPIVISAGVGREGTAAANAALAHRLGLKASEGFPSVSVDCRGSFDASPGVVVRAVVDHGCTMPGSVEIYGSIEAVPERHR